jgi:hypothetical protein
MMPARKLSGSALPGAPQAHQAGAGKALFARRDHLADHLADQAAFGGTGTFHDRPRATIGFDRHEHSCTMICPLILGGAEADRSPRRALRRLRGENDRGATADPGTAL